MGSLYLYPFQYDKKKTKGATVLLAYDTATLQIVLQITGRRIEHGTLPNIKPKYQNLDVHDNNYYHLLTF